MPRTPPQVSVVIPNWNGLGHLPECTEALAAQSFRDFETILVDNASTDGSIAWIGEHHPEIRLIERPDNGGFAKAVNEGIRASRSEYVALLNNDTAVDPGWLEALVKALDSHPAYNFAASKMLLYHEPHLINAAGDVLNLMCMSGENRGYREPAERYDKMERVLGACAGAALYRRSLFAEVGLFDEDFFLIHEDTDFNLRCLIAGKRCLYVPSALVLHKMRASIDKEPPAEMRRLAVRNVAMVAAKNLPTGMLILRLVTWAYRSFRHTVPLRPSKWHLLPALLREAPQRFGADREGYRMGLAKRSKVWRLQAISTREIRRWLRKGHGPV